jgi:hypothetical protein
MLFIKLLILAYLMSLIIMYLVARSAIKDRSWRFIFCVIGVALPFVIVLVGVRSLFTQNRSRLNYVPEIAAVEDAIERERTEIFGGEVLWPSFSKRWERACQLEMQRVVLWSDRATRRLKQFKQHWSVRAA